MEKTVYSALGESVWHGRLPNGLHIYVDEKPEYGKQFAFFAACYGLEGLRARRRCSALLEQIGLEDKTEYYVDGLSKGMQQRNTSCSTPRTATPSRSWRPTARR